MVKFYNQLLVKIHKNEEQPNWRELLEACRRLNGAALKLYIYLSSFADEEEVNLSPTNFAKATGASAPSEKNAFRELQLEGIIEQIDETHYSFRSIV